MGITIGAFSMVRFLDLSEARSRMYRSQLLQLKAHAAEIFKLYKIINTSFQMFSNFLDFCAALLQMSTQFRQISSEGADRQDLYIFL